MTRIGKAVIPAAGLGTRFLPITKAQPKEMLPVLHKPVIQYVVEEAYASGIREILIITGKGKRAIEDHFDRAEMPAGHSRPDGLEEMLQDLDIFFVRQKEIRGLGHAVGCAESFVRDEPFALLLGDTITAPPCTREICRVHAARGGSVVAVEQVPREKVPLYGIVAGRDLAPGIASVDELVEKPPVDEAPSSLAILGRYILTPGIFDCIRETLPGAGNEIQLTDALRILGAREPVLSYLYRGHRYDIGNKVDWLKANVELALMDPGCGPEFREFLGAALRGSAKRGRKGR